MRRLFLAAFLLGSPCAAENIKLTLWHTSDIHGWIMPRAAKDGSKRMEGGFAALASVVRADKGPKLLLDSGDWFQGTPEGSLSKGEVSVELFNALGYDAVLAGNHDFDFGRKRLAELSEKLKMPLLGANIYAENSRKRPKAFRGRIIKKISGVKIGIFGVTYQNMKAMTFPENIKGLEFRRPVDEARDDVAELKKEGADVVVALTHLGFESLDFGAFEGDQTLARQVPGIDVILGGHTHRFIEDPPHINGTLITEPGIGLTAVDKVVLEIDPKTKKVVLSKGELVHLWIDRTGEAEDVKRLVAKAQGDVSKVYDVVIATAAEDIRRSRDSESAMGDWFTDCVRGWSGADVAFSNGAGIRGDFAAGPVTVRSVYNVMPFDNRLVALTLTGAQLRQALDHGSGRGWEMVQESGATFSYRRDNPERERISDLAIGGKPVELAGRYKVEASDFLVAGGEGFAFKDAPQEPSRTLLRDVIRRCAETQRLLKAPPKGRMVSLEDNGGTQERSR